MTTQSTYDGLGNLQQLTSPDTGTTTYTHDAAGNVLRRSDARSATADTTYDALNRPTRIVYSDSSAILLGYDAGPNAKGRLSHFGDPTGSTVFAYDPRGRIAGKTQTTGSRSYTVLYPRDAHGRPLATVYPSGKLVVTLYDGGGRPYALAASTGGGFALLHYVARFQPFGPPTISLQGNGQTRADLYDLDGRPYAYSRDGDYRYLSYDAASRIEFTLPLATPALLERFTHDDLDRLTGWLTTSGQQAYAYDATGNRLALTTNGTRYDYSYPPSSHRLQGTTGPAPAQSNTYDAAGHLIGDGTHSFSYDARGRMSGASGGGSSAAYGINALGQRVSKTLTPGGTTHYLHDEAGHLLGEYDAATGQAIAEYVWYGDRPIALLRGSLAAPEILYVETDHLGTPRQVRDAERRLRWQWDPDPFGRAAPDENPSGLGTLVLNLRFPGQYFDRETGLHYNYFRDYDPGTGRYVQSDPIGLAGGVNTYSYANQNPLQLTDPTGTTWQSNWDFFWDWWNETGVKHRNYGPNDFQTREIMNSAAADSMRNAFKSGGCKDIQKAGYGTLQGYWDTGVRPWEWGSTATQVGGFIWSAVNVGNCKVRYRVYNQASLYSFFLHVPGMPHKPRGGWFPWGGNIDQVFEWTETSPCGCSCQSGGS